MKKQTSILSENHIFECINKYFPHQNQYIKAGRDDDCAILSIQTPLCISTDFFIENRHFRQTYFTPEEIGWKALAVNLSDLAACAAQPIAFSLGLAIPKNTSMEIIEGLCLGMSNLAQKSNILLAGGDISQSQELCLCITVIGTNRAPLLRNQASSGDVLFLLGNVGLAKTGLYLLEKIGRSALNNFPESCNAHIKPKPLINQALLIAQIAKEWKEQTQKTHRLGLMDVSDGLAQDVPRLLGKDYGIDIHIPYIHPEITQFLANNDSNSAEIHAFIGGEDYSLIGTCSPEFISVLKKNIPEITILGHINKNTDITCNGQKASGFDHFAS